MLRTRITAILFVAALIAGCGNKEGQNTEEYQEAGDPVQRSGKDTQANRQNILFFGTSLTAGYGLNSPQEAYPALIQQKIDSMGWPYKVINGGLSGETSAAGKNRIDWLLKQPIDVFVLELGANDGLRGLSIPQTTANLQSIINKVKAKYPDVKMLMLGMQMPPSMGPKYTTDFRDMYPALAKKNNMAYVPFLLEGVGGVPKLNQDDGIHPTSGGHKILAENVWKILRTEIAPEGRDSIPVS